MIDILKQLALDAVDAGSFADFSIGTVKQVHPLVIEQEDGPELTERFLLLSRMVTEHEERGKIKTWTEYEPVEWAEYRLIRQVGLKAGERVILAKTSGGQQYLVLDRIGNKEG